MVKPSTPTSPSSGQAVLEPGQFVKRLDVPGVVDRSAVAELSSVLIDQMSCDELVRVIQLADLPSLRYQAAATLAHFDRDTLLRLAYLARRCCQAYRCS